MFKGATIGSDILMGSLGAEASTGQIELVAAELAIMGAVIAFRKIKQKVENKRDRKHNEEQQRNDAAETERQRQLQEQADRQAELDRQMQEAEAERQRQAAVAEQQRQEAIAEQQRQQAIAEQQRQTNIDINQTALNQQRLQENQADIQRAQDYVVREENQMEYSREQRINQDLSNIQPYDYRAPGQYDWWGSNTWNQIQNQPGQQPNNRLRGQDVNIQGYYDAPPFNPIWPIAGSMGEDEGERETWRLISGDDIIDSEYPSYDPNYRQGLNPPDGGPDDEPNGGNGGMPSGPGGPGRPGGPNGGNGNNNGRNPANNNANPYADILKQIAGQIQAQKNKEKKSVEQATDQPPVQPVQPSTGIIGGNPATWTPITPNQPNPATQGNDYPGKNGAGTLRPVPIEQEKKGQAGLDNAHIAQQEMEAIIAAQGNAELTNEEQLAQLELIDQKMSNFASAAQARTVKLAPSSVFSGSVTRF